MSLIGTKGTWKVPINAPTSDIPARSFNNRNAIHDPFGTCRRSASLYRRATRRHSAADSRSAFGEIHHRCPSSGRATGQYVTVTNSACGAVRYE